MVKPSDQTKVLKNDSTEERILSAAREEFIEHGSRGARMQAIADRAAEHGVGIRHGHYYAYRLLQRMRIEPEDGVARVSLAHTNTMEEVEKLIEALAPVLRS